MGSCHTSTEGLTTFQIVQDNPSSRTHKLQNLAHICISMPPKRKEISKQQSLTKYLLPVAPQQIDIQADSPKSEHSHQESKMELFSSINQQICEEKKDAIDITESEIIKYDIGSFLKALPVGGTLFEGVILKVLANRTISRYGMIDRESFRYYTNEYSSKKWLSKPLLLLKISYIKRAIR
jgi:hypothetical protein